MAIVTDRLRFWAGAGVLAVVLVGASEVVAFNATGYFWPFAGPDQVIYDGHPYDTCIPSDLDPAEVARARAPDGATIYADAHDPHPWTIHIKSGISVVECEGHGL